MLSFAGPSDHPELCDFLVEQGIDSISLSPDRVLPTLKQVYEAEQKLATKKQAMDWYIDGTVLFSNEIDLISFRARDGANSQNTTNK